MAKKKKTKKDTLICFVLDESGSMLGVKDQTISGYNEYVNALRDSKKTRMMLTKFNSAAINLGDIEPIDEAIILDAKSYWPDHITPLYDAVGQSISKVEAEKDGHNVVFVIMTDGLENASKEFTREGIFNLIKERTEDGWNFIYLGANQDAFAVGRQMGVQANSTANFSQSKTAQTFSAAAMGTQRLMDEPEKPYKWTEEELEDMEE